MKNIALLGMGLGLGVAVAALFAVQPTPLSVAAQCLGWTFVAAFLVWLGLQLRRDLAPDYLWHCTSKVFERDGFCFNVSLDEEAGIAMFTVMFQSRYLGPAIARVAIRPANSSLATVSPDIECGPGGFGVAKFPVAIPRRHQGKTVTFEIGADAEYPLGKGREVRFRNGRRIRHNSRFCNPITAVQAIAYSLAGHFVVHSPAKIRLTLPLDVAEYVPESAVGDAQMLWSFSENETLKYAITNVTKR